MNYDHIEDPEVVELWHYADEYDVMTSFEADNVDFEQAYYLFGDEECFGLSDSQLAKMEASS